MPQGHLAVARGVVPWSGHGRGFHSRAPSTLPWALGRSRNGTDGGGRRGCSWSLLMAMASLLTAVALVEAGSHAVACALRLPGSLELGRMRAESGFMAASRLCRPWSSAKVRRPSCSPVHACCTMRFNCLKFCPRRKFITTIITLRTRGEGRGERQR
jgi:hypothetical protein